MLSAAKHLLPIEGDSPPGLSGQGQAPGLSGQGQAPGLSDQGQDCVQNNNTF